MKATASLLGALLGAALLVSSARAQCCYYPGIPQAPDMCGPGFYCPNCCGQQYGPNYCVQPPFPPFQGMVKPPPQPAGPGGPGGAGAAGPGGARAGGPGGPAGSPSFPTYAFARSPRDYFMIYQNREPLYPGIYSSSTDFYPQAALQEYRIPGGR